MIRTNSKVVHKDPLPAFKSQAEEDEFWKNHSWSDYLAERGAVHYKKGTKSVYAEGVEIDDPNLTENVNIRFDKKTVAELKAVAENDDRTLASLIRRWVLEKLREEKYRFGRT